MLHAAIQCIFIVIYLKIMVIKYLNLKVNVCDITCKITYGVLSTLINFPTTGMAYFFYLQLVSLNNYLKICKKYLYLRKNKHMV